MLVLGSVHTISEESLDILSGHIASTSLHLYRVTPILGRPRFCYRKVLWYTCRSTGSSAMPNPSEDTTVFKSSPWPHLFGEDIEDVDVTGNACCSSLQRLSKEYKIRCETRIRKDVVM